MFTKRLVKNVWLYSHPMAQFKFKAVTTAPTDFVPQVPFCRKRKTAMDAAFTDYVRQQGHFHAVKGTEALTVLNAQICG
jgi:hypothetical protein